MAAPASQQQLRPEDFHETPEKPLLQCDLIMKGGVTSGVVYPAAVIELAKRYKFRSIVGASAGAIAAAGAAAAELGRTLPRPGAGFVGLHELRGELTEPGHLIDLFRPDGGTGPLFDLFTGMLDRVEADRPTQTGLIDRVRGFLDQKLDSTTRTARRVLVVVGTLALVALAGGVLGLAAGWDRVGHVLAIAAGVLLLCGVIVGAVVVRRLRRKVRNLGDLRRPAAGGHHPPPDDQ